MGGHGGKPAGKEGRVKKGRKKKGTDAERNGTRKSRAVEGQRKSGGREEGKAGIRPSLFVGFQEGTVSSRELDWVGTVSENSDTQAASG